MQKLVQLKARRKHWLQVHLWLGLALGLFLSIFGITGSILVFYAEIEELLNPDMLVVAPPLDNVGVKPLSDIFKNGSAAMPPQAKHTFATYPRNAEAAFILRYALPLASDVTEYWQVAVNPYTAEVTGKQLTGSSDSFLPKTFIGIVFELHYALLLDESPGYVIVGIMGALLIISVLTGLIVWWPLTGKWLKALTIKRNASYERLNVDLHKTFGFYSTLVLLPVLFSGVYMDVPKHVVPVIELFSPVTYRYWFKSTPSKDAKPLPMAKAIAIAEQHYPSGRLDTIYGINDPSSTYTVCKDDVQEAGSFLHRRCIVMDQYSGKLLDDDNPVTGTAGETFTHWQMPLHAGKPFGWTGRILVFLSGLACPVLFVTGVIRWLQKRRTKAQHQLKQYAANRRD
ncbi:MAG: PepSY-associated TM helix domain-containing protein [Methylococcales bacterium]